MQSEMQASGAQRRHVEPSSAEHLDGSYGSKVLLATVVVLVLMAVATLWWPRP